MDRSSGFGSTPSDSSPCSDSLSLRLPYPVKLATECKSLTHYTKGTQSPLAGLLLFVCTRFQDLFHSPSGVLFAFPSRYWFTIGRYRVFSLGGWSPHLQTGFLVSRPTCRTPSTTHHISHTGLSPAMAGLSIPFCYVLDYHALAAPISLATTLGISVDFFSCSYLDVSVRRVRFHTPMYSGRDDPCGPGFPIRTSADQCLFASSPQLFAGYHVLLRLISPRHPPCALSHLSL